MCALSRNAQEGNAARVSIILDGFDEIKDTFLIEMHAANNQVEPVFMKRLQSIRNAIDEDKHMVCLKGVP
jgi:hypothetical protein